MSHRDSGEWNIKGHNKRGKGSFHDWFSSKGGGSKKPIKSPDFKPKGAALALSKKLLADKKK